MGLVALAAATGISVFLLFPEKPEEAGIVPGRVIVETGPDYRAYPPQEKDPFPEGKGETVEPKPFPDSADADPRLEMSVLASHYMETAPAEGILFFEQLLQAGEGHLARAFLRAFSNRLAEDHPLALAAWIEDLPEAFRNEATVALIFKGTARDLEGVGKWIATLEDGAHKTRAVGLFGQHMAVDPDNPYYRDWAWDLLANTTDPGPFLKVITPLLAREDPEFVYSLIEEMGTPDLQLRTLEGFVSVLAASRPRETLEWIQTFNDADLRRHLEDRSLEALGRQAPGEAAVWILAYPDCQDFETRVSRLAAVWADSDPAAARAFIDQAPLSDTRRAYLLATLP